MRLITTLLISNLIFAYCTAQLPPIIPFRTGLKWGFCDSTKKVIISPMYDSVETYDFKKDQVNVYSENTKSAIRINVNSNEIIKVNIPNTSVAITKKDDEDIPLFHANFSTKRPDKKHIPQKLTHYSYVENLDINLYLIWNDKKMGVSDSMDNKVIPCIYSNIIFVKNLNLFKVFVDNQVGVIKEGRILIDTSYDYIQELADAMILLVKKKSQYGLYSLISNQFISVNNDEIYWNSGKLLWLRKGKTFAYYLTSKQKFSGYIFDGYKKTRITFPVPVSVNRKWGLIDSNENYIFKPQFDDLKLLYNFDVPTYNDRYYLEIYKVRFGAKNGYIDNKGTKYWTN